MSALLHCEGGQYCKTKTKKILKKTLELVETTNERNKSNIGRVAAFPWLLERAETFSLVRGVVKVTLKSFLPYDGTATFPRLHFFLARARRAQFRRCQLRPKLVRLTTRGRSGRYSDVVINASQKPSKTGSYLSQEISVQAATPRDVVGNARVTKLAANSGNIEKSVLARFALRATFRSRKWLSK